MPKPKHIIENYHLGIRPFAGYPCLDGYVEGENKWTSKIESIKGNRVETKNSIYILKGPPAKFLTTLNKIDSRINAPDGSKLYRYVRGKGKWYINGFMYKTLWQCRLYADFMYASYR